MKNDFYDCEQILITGGTGTFGKALVHKLLTEYKPKKMERL